MILDAYESPSSGLSNAVPYVKRFEKNYISVQFVPLGPIHSSTRRARSEAWQGSSRDGRTRWRANRALLPPARVPVLARFCFCAKENVATVVRALRLEPVQRGLQRKVEVDRADRLQQKTNRGGDSYTHIRSVEADRAGRLRQKDTQRWAPAASRQFCSVKSHHWVVRKNVVSWKSTHWAVRKDSSRLPWACRGARRRTLACICSTTLTRLRSNALQVECSLSPLTPSHPPTRQGRPARWSWPRLRPSPPS